MKRFKLAGIMALLCFIMGTAFLLTHNPVSWLFQAVAFVYLIAMIKLED